MSLSAVKLALAVKRARAQSGAPDVLNSEPIAVVGMGCRFPGDADSPEAYWRLLRDGVDAIVDLPRGRWPRTPRLPPCQGGFLKEVDRFDAEYFGIPRLEAERMDPQQRLLMEVVWESLWDARMAPETLAGERSGVFAAIYNSDYFRLQFGDPDRINAYTSTGTSHSAAVGRVSFLLDWKGPSVAVDTACSSSLVAIHLACRSLRAGECRMALAGGVSMILAPEELISLTKLGMLAADFRCKTFDSRADGFVPGEGCGIVVLKRLSDALADGDNIRAVIRGTALNQDGRTTVLTAPSGPSQQAVIRDALANAQILGSEIGYVEAHGTGTVLGDPIELEALAEVIGSGPEPCFLGSAKTNIGHLEAAAGVAGVMKAVLALEKEEIPRSLHFRQLNPHASLQGTRLAIAGSAVAWPRGAAPRFAGISSFGFGGTNGHVIVEEAPAYGGARRPAVAPHVWRRERYWIPAPPRRDEPAQEHPLLGRRLSSPVFRETVFEGGLGADSPEYLADHQPGGETLLPLAAFLEMFLAASGAGALEEVTVQAPLVLPAQGTRRVQVTADGDALRLYSLETAGWALHASGRAGAVAEVPPAANPEDLRRAAGRESDVAEFYAALDARGLRFGPAFRVVEQLWTGEAGALARVALPEGAEGYRFHPALLDGCFQILGALLPAGGGVYLPLGLKRFTLFRPAGRVVWSQASIRPGAGNALTADIRIFGPQGQPVAAAEGLWLRKPRSEVVEERLCEMRWQPRARKTAEAVATGGNWLVFADSTGVGDAVAAGLQAGGAACRIVRAGEPFEALLEDRELCGVAHLWSLDAPASAELDCDALQRAQRAVCGSLLRVVQKLAEREGDERPRLWIVTQGAQRTGAEQREVSVAQAPVWGLGRTIRREHPELRAVVVDLDPLCAEAGRVLDEIRGPDGEGQIAWRGNVRMAPRLVNAGREPARARLEIAGRGRLEELRWSEAARRRPGPGEVEILVEATGLNFRDVLNALGEYPGDAGPLGSECAGRIVEAGTSVTGLKAGDEVFGVARGSFATHVTTAADLLALKPAGLSMEEAATIPGAYVTARYALESVGGIQAGERVLIHAAAGGVGLAAVAEAQRMGAEVFATAGSDEKRAYLGSLGVAHVMNSRTLEYGREVMERTNGQGVDVVLNSLAGEHITASLKALARGGRFLELGKKDIWAPARVAALRNDIGYFAIDWGEEYERNPQAIVEVFGSVVRDAADGRLMPLPSRTFAKGDVVNAFRWMAQGRHIGKVLVRQASLGGMLRRDGSYLITGGLGALGIRVAEWMAERGAGVVVLAGRSEPGEEALAAIGRMKKLGTRVLVRRTDVSRPEELGTLIRDIGSDGKPLRGLVHAAGVLADGVLARQNWERFAVVMAPKVEAAWRLHELTAGLNLDFFILFSSLASVLGSPGQGNYAAANAFLDGLAQHRRALGLPALSIDWGPWGEAGMATGPEGRDWQRSFPTIRAFSRQQGLKVLDSIQLDDTAPQIAAFLSLQQGTEADLESDVLSDTSGPGNFPEGASGADSRLGPLASALCGEALVEFLRDEAAKVMGIEDSRLLDTQEPLFDAGLDSLMAVEFRNVLVAAFGRPFSSTLLFDYPTIEKVAALLEGTGRKEPDASRSRLEREIDALDEAEAEMQLNAELEKGGGKVN